ncbi:MAG: hypothetical protein SFY68_14105 [Candidatus Sumerlaeia bacterium]|nr:hypothetical protein [Candidatus Sumerlaeia bacterium]
MTQLKTLQVECPECGGILIVDAKSGAVLEHRKPLLNKEERTGDRFEDARKKVESASDRIAKKVAEVEEAQRTKFDRLNALFSEKKKELEESGEPIERPEGFGDRD